MHEKAPDGTGIRHIRQKYFWSCGFRDTAGKSEKEIKPAVQAVLKSEHDGGNLVIANLLLPSGCLRCTVWQLAERIENDAGR